MKTKTKKQTTKIILLVLTLITIQGCATNHQIPDTYRGTQGIELSFMNNAPPNTVQENSFTNIMIEIWNKGAYNIPENELLLSLKYDDIYFKEDLTDEYLFTSQNPEGLLKNELAGKSQEWPAGERLLLPLTRLNVLQILGTRETPTTNIELVACYPYKTFLTQTICLDTDIYGVDKNPICRNRETYIHSNQGAPIAITKIEVDILPMGFIESPVTDSHAPVVNETGELIGLELTSGAGTLVLVEPVIRIYARNLGRGDVFISKQENTETMNLCTFRDESFMYRDHNKVKLLNATLDGLDMDCGTKNTLNLALSSDFITCRLHPNQTGYLRQNLEVPLYIELDYYYRESITKPIRIQRTS
ncbi:hypothetical protein KO361_03815 [Candidatus Woesearchaeota archaeon]|nr:hypothetical protein [Candidatus Woesearchaeota archaeon]